MRTSIMKELRGRASHHFFATGESFNPKTSSTIFKSLEIFENLSFEIQVVDSEKVNLVHLVTVSLFGDPS